MNSFGRRLIGRAVLLQEHEATTALMMFAYSFLAMTAYNIVSPATQSSFISALGADNLPYVQLVAGVLIAGIMQLYGRGVARLPRRRVIPATQTGEVVLLVLFYFLLQTDAEWVSVAFYLLGNILGILLISQFWTLANDIYDARQAKRLFGFIGGGASLGGVVGSGLTSFAVEAVGTANLLLISAATLAVCSVLVAAIVGRADVGRPADTPREEAGPDRGGAVELLRSSRHLQLIALIIACAGIGSVIIKQQLSMAVEAATGPGNTDAITALLARVTFYSSLAGFLLQVFLTSRIHRSFGLAFALLILPVSLGASSVMMLVSASLWAPMVGRALDTSLRYNVDKTTREMLFLPLPTEVKYRAKQFVDVVVDRVTRAAGALLLLALIKPWGLSLAWHELGYASLAITGIWVAVAVAARREYLRVFRRTLETRAVVPASLRLDVADAVTIETLVEELSDPDEERVLYAIEILETLDKRNLITPLLLHHESPAIRTRALLALESARPTTGERWRPTVERMLNDEDGSVRAAAVHALASLRREEASQVMRQYLSDPEPRVAVTAAAVLADTGSPDDERAAGATLRALSGDAGAVTDRSRREVAAALGQIRNPRLRPLLLPLMTDADLEVAQTALRSAMPLGANDAMFVPALVMLLGHRQLKPLARQVLASGGDAFLDALVHFMKDPGENLWVRRHVPATLAAIPTQRSMDALIVALEERDGFLRFKAVAAVERLGRDRPGLTVQRAPVESLLRRETSRYHTYLTLRASVLLGDPRAHATLLVRALDDKLERTRDRTYRLLGLIYPWKDIAAARYTLSRGDVRARAAALEYLDNLFDSALRRRVLPMLDDTSIEEKVRQANALLRTRPRALDDALAQLVHDDDPVVASAAIHCAVDLGVRVLADDLEYVEAHSTAHVPCVGEAASWALAGWRVPDGDAESPSRPWPTVELASRLRAIRLFDVASVDELFRVAEAGRKVGHRPGRTLYRRGVQPGDVLCLLDGRVRMDADDGSVEECPAPRALAFEEVLRGSPMRHTITTVDHGVCLALGREQLFMMLSDSIVFVPGLLGMLLDAPAGRWPTVHTPPAASPPVGPLRQALQPIDKAILLRQNPLLARATLAQLLDVAAVAREVPLAAGQTLLADGEAPAIYHVLSGRACVDIDGADPIDAGPGATIGLAETLAGVPTAGRVRALQAGRALRIDRDELLDVLAERFDLLHGIVLTLLNARETAQAAAPRVATE